MKIISQEYRDLLDHNIEITGGTRIRAEWSWNNTQYLAPAARNGVKMQIIDNSGLYKNVAGTVGEEQNKDGDRDFFRQCFDIEENNRLNGMEEFLQVNNRPVLDQDGNLIRNPGFSEPFKGPFLHRAPSWRTGENAPNFELDKHFSVIMEFHLDIKEEGWYLYKIEADDRYEFYLFDEQMQATNIAASNYEAGDYWHKPEDRNGYIAAYFGVPGRYYAKALLQNVDLDAAFVMSYSSPRTRRENGELPFTSKPTLDMMKFYQYTKMLTEHVVYPEDHGPTTNPEVVGLDRVIEKNTYFDEEEQSVKSAREDIHEWNKWREYFPTDSMVQPHRPKSGINFNMIEGGVAGHIITEEDFINRPFEPRKPRYYGISTRYPGHTYWISDCRSETEPFNDSYLIPLADLSIKYTEPMPSNKIRLVFNLGPMPEEFRILYSSDEFGDEWSEAATNRTCSINPYTGEIELWRQRSGLWGEEPYFDEDNSDLIRRLRVVVLSMQEPNKRVEILEFGALKHIDITESVESFALNTNMDEVNQFRIVGTSSANGGDLNLSDLDKRFSFDHLSDIRNKNFQGIATDASNLKVVVERQTKFTFDVLYEDKDRNETHPVRIGTMYATDWEDSDSGHKLNLFDSAKYLQNVSAPDAIFENKPIHYVIGCILDLVGFSDYSLDMSDFKKNQIPGEDDRIDTPVMKFFATDPTESVWKALQDICAATYSAVYFDEYGTLQLITKDEITRPLQRDEITRQTIEPPAHILRGQRHDGRHPNIISFTKNHEDEANSVSIKFQPKKIKENDDPYNPEQLTDILWQADRTITLQAARLIEPLEKGEEKEFWIDSHAERAELWPYSGRGNINGEIIEWNGKEYQWIEYVWEKYADVIVNVAIVPKLIRPEFEIFQQWIDATAGGANHLVSMIPPELAILGFKIDLGGLKGWLSGIINFAKESGEALIHEPTEVVTNYFTRSGIDGTNELDRVLISRIMRKEWIYNETQRRQRNENTGRGNAFERRLNRFTGRIRLVPRAKNTRGRGVDDSRYTARHSHLPKDGWYAKKIREFRTGMEDGYWSGKLGSEDHLTWYPIHKVEDGVFGDSFQTSIGIRRVMEQDIASDRLAALVRKAEKPIKSIGFRFRFEREQAKFGEIGLLFNASYLEPDDWFGIFNRPASEGTIPDNINDVNQYYKLIIKETTDHLDRSRSNEVDAQAFTDDTDYDVVEWFHSINRIGHNTWQLRNMNAYERDETVRYRGYATPIHRMTWYDVQVDIMSDTLFSVSINGQTIGSFDVPRDENTNEHRMPVSPYFGIFARPGVQADIDYIWSWSEEGGLLSYNDYSRYDTSRGQYVSSFLESNFLVPTEENREFRSTDGRLGDFFFDDFGSVVHEIRDFDVELDKGPGMSATYYVSNPNVKMFDTAYTPNRAKFSLVNLSSHLVIANGDETIAEGKTVKNTILVYGYKIMEERERTILRKNMAAVKDRGEVQEEIDAQWISSDEEAIELANWIVQNFSDVKDSAILEVFPDAAYSIGDRIQVIYDEKDIDPEWIYIINGIQWQFAPKSFTCNLNIRRVRNNNIEYFDIDDPEFGIKKEEIHLADSRDTGVMSEGGVSGLTLYGPVSLNPEGLPPSNFVNENPTWKSRYPIAGFLFDTITGMGIDILVGVASAAITAAATSHGVPPQATAIGLSIFSQLIEGGREIVFTDEPRYGM